MKKILLGTLILFACLPTFAQVNDNFSILTERMERLERDMTFMQRRIYQAQEDKSGFSFMNFGKKQQPSGGPIDQTDDLYTKITAQEELIQNLTSRLETQTFELSQLNDKIAKMNADTEIRFKMLEDKTPVVEAVKPAQPSKSNSSDKAQATAGGSAKEQYDVAYGMLKKGDHVAAEKAFITFIKQNPKSDLAGNANYWLGETYYARGQYEQAIGTFAEGFTTYKKNSKAPDNLLKLGMSMSFLKKKEEACTAFNSLPTEFPKADASLKKRAGDEAKKLSCP